LKNVPPDENCRCLTNSPFIKRSAVYADSLSIHTHTHTHTQQLSCFFEMKLYAL